MKQFYTYIWLREHDGTFPAGYPYYVGKGHGKRAHQTRRHIRCPKDHSYIVILKCESEAEAFDMEKHFINQWGRIDLGTGCLRNQTDGGEGTSGRKRTEEERQAISKGMVGNKNGSGQKLTEEEKQAISIRMVGNQNGLGNKANWVPSEEARRNIRAAAIITQNRPEVRAKARHIRWHVRRGVANPRCSLCNSTT